MKNTITLQLDVFEGPFELLLYLIKKNDLEISRVSLSEVTTQYLTYLDALRELNIDLASDFLYMAAELTYIKSRTLLPTEKQLMDEEEDDPRAADLIAKLKEYERYKMAAMDLKNRKWLHRDVFARGSFLQEDDEINQQEKTETTTQYDVDAMELIKAFSEVLERLPKEKRDHHVIVERISVTDRIYEILDRFQDRESVVFADLFEGDHTRMDVVISFLAILEMGKLKMIYIYQTDMFNTIRIQRKIDVNPDILNNKDILDTLETYK